jgi:hypothetical protein
MRTAVGVPDLRLLGGVEPDFALPDALDGGGEAFLGTEINCILGLLGEKKKGRDEAYPSSVVGLGECQ